jgi:predicted transcriptional regulator
MDIDISVDEVLYGMTRSEKKEMLESLLDHMDHKVVMECLKNSNLTTKLTNIVSKESDEEFNTKVMSLINNRYKLSPQEELFVINLCTRVNP